ncbi:MAG: DUF4194 domain-containing protein [Sedimenticola sp.]
MSEQPEEPNSNKSGDEGAAPLTGEREATPQAVKAALQELMKYGVLEADRKPNLYRTVIVSGAAITTALEPLDMAMGIDDIRGVAYLTIVDGYADSERDEWSHPLVRRQRLTLEQSLLTAILRQLYVVHEMEAGIGASAAVVHLDDLMPELNQFLGESGSDSRDEKRLRQLLEQLRGHGLVSEIDKAGQLMIRPLIVHIANPENLQNLLTAFVEQVKCQPEVVE